MKMSEFVNKWRKAIDDSKYSKAPLPLFVDLENRISDYEIKKLISTYINSGVEVTEESLQPFIEFLHDRWGRIKGTDADYKSFPKSYSNEVSTGLAKALVRCTDPRFFDKPALSKYEHEVILKEAASVYLTPGGEPEYVGTSEERQSWLRERVAVRAKCLFGGQTDLFNLMANDIEKCEWQDFIKCCDLESLKELLFPHTFLKEHGNVYDAVTASASDDCNDVKMFCLLEVYKRQRDLDPTYIGWGRSLTGIRAGRRVSQAQRLQDFLVSGECDLDHYMKQFKSDDKSLLSGHMKTLALMTKELREDKNDSRLSKAIG